MQTVSGSNVDVIYEVSSSYHWYLKHDRSGEHALYMLANRKPTLITGRRNAVRILNKLVEGSYSIVDLFYGDGLFDHKIKPAVVAYVTISGMIKA